MIALLKVKKITLTVNATKYKSLKISKEFWIFRENKIYLRL